MVASEHDYPMSFDGLFLVDERRSGFHIALFGFVFHVSHWHMDELGDGHGRAMKDT